MAMISTFTELENEGCTVVMIGVGNIGLEAIKAYSMPVYGDERSIVQSITLCDDRAFRHKRKSRMYHPTDSPVYLAQRRKEVIVACKACDILIVFADVDQDPDFDFTCRFGNLHRMNAKPHDLSICITCARENTFAVSHLRKCFDNVIFTSSTPQEMCRPAEMILTDLYTQAIGLDVADVRSALSHFSELHFKEKQCATREDISAMLDELHDEVIDRIALSDLNFLAYMSNSSLDGLPDIREVYDAFVDEEQNGVQLFQMGYNKDPLDRSTRLSFLYGKVENNKEKSPPFDEYEWLCETER